MPTHEQFLGVICKLIAKSHKNEVNWNVYEDYETALTLKPRRIPIYTVVFQDGSTIEVSHHIPVGGMDYVQVQLLRQQRIIYTLTIEDTQENYDLLYELYQAADRSVNKWADTITTIEQELDREGTIGQTITN